MNIDYIVTLWNLSSNKNIKSNGFSHNNRELKPFSGLSTTDWFWWVPYYRSLRRTFVNGKATDKSPHCTKFLMASIFKSVFIMTITTTIAGSWKSARMHSLSQLTMGTRRIKTFVKSQNNNAYCNMACKHLLDVIHAYTAHIRVLYTCGGCRFQICVRHHREC